MSKNILGPQMFSYLQNIVDSSSPVLSLEMCSAIQVKDKVAGRVLEEGAGKSHFGQLVICN